ncbi:GIY-YIG nuclease family protein [uncultured Clostridium sp.]|uniref:GIY-YIG nuclease family protein n=1 Tax=uncultured Clostridium sp. TaxID=59620 RepID=UPI0026EC0B89|nr:GIY-YIG nuclease family protein [uncultured Clostridium sp.]
MKDILVLYGYVYLVRNKLNNKIYVGQHRSNIIDYSYYGSGTIITRAIRKYGIDNFELKVLSWASNRTELNMLEKFYILLYKSTDREFGYNIQTGGQGSYLTHNYIHLRGKDNPCYGMRRTPEQKKKLKEIHSELRKQGKCGVKGRVAITDGISTKFAKPEELNTFLNRGWRKGKMPSRPKNENSKNQQSIKHAEIQKSKRLLSGIELENTHQTTLGRKCINNGFICKYVYEFELDDFTNNGWKIGKLPVTNEQRKRMSEAQKESLDKRPEYKKKLAERFRANGYKSTKGKLCMNNGIKNIYVFPNEIDNYKNMGYVLGGKSRVRRK